MAEFTKLLVANRSEIAIRVCRSAHELGIRTVAIYPHEDRYALHRFKADEAYEIGSPGEPIKSYLDIPGIVHICKQHGVDAVHPGYGFLSERPAFAQALADEGITFVGPSVDVLRALGDKTSARELAVKAGVPILSGSEGALASAEEGLEVAESLGFPVIIKASHGGGGRGMRVVREAASFVSEFEQARRESLLAFGSDEIFVEKFVEKARHIEVQLLGDTHGNLRHLYERDCSVQRRHQKVVEIAPAPNLTPSVREELCKAALKIGSEVGYSCAGTVEFLVDADTEEFFFIEVNPRIQVEHTVTEEVTGIDIVKAQILIAQGSRLEDSEIDLPNQDTIKTHGSAIQCRVTTEDPTNGFMPDYGKVEHYRSAGGMGIRLDAGTVFSGAVVSPFYDSMLVKVTARGHRYIDAARRMERCLSEFRIRGVKTNIPFLLKLIQHPTFLDGSCTTRFIDQTPELFEFPERKDRATKLLSFIGNVIVNGNELVKDRPVAVRREPVPLPEYDENAEPPSGMRQKLQELGPEKFARYIREQKPLLLTDVSFRDAHQSLFATRMRSYDLLAPAEAYAHRCPQLFSLEMWGGATFDTSMRFLKEDPWQRLAGFRERVPNILLQMLLRASNAVGYTNYPDNIVQEFVKEAAAAGIDVFRVFDALNWVPNMRVAMDAVNDAGAVCEAAICYTGDILDPSRTKYSLKYYLEMARQLQEAGAHVIAIKDMAGLCKPEAARILVKALRETVGLPIHFHTHDTAGIQGAAILNAAEVGLDITDAAMAPMSGGTSHPNLNAISEALRFGERATGIDSADLDALADYWRSVRDYYLPFQSPVLPAGADLYRHEMPGGQYTNLYQQARALGLSDQWPRVCETYAQVNQLFGDIVKVTPTSKAVGDMALFMVANDLTAQDVIDPDRELAFPASVVDLIGGRMGRPMGGFPPEVERAVLRGKEPLRERPGAGLEPADFEAGRREAAVLLKREPSRRELISYLLYPQVFKDFAGHLVDHVDTSMLPTPTFLYGLQAGEEIAVDIEKGKTLIIKFLSIGEPHEDGTRLVTFELNGQPRSVTITDQSLAGHVPTRVKADPANPDQIGSSMPGMVVKVHVEEGDEVTKGRKLLVLEAMKMETTIYAERPGTVGQVLVKPGSQVETGDLLLSIG